MTSAKQMNPNEEYNFDKQDQTVKIFNNKIDPNLGAVEKKEASFFNRYATKKTFSNGLMDGALLATNAAQLRLLLTEGFMYPKDPKWVISISLVVASIIAQLAILVICGYLANNTLANRAKKAYLEAMNNIVLVLTGVIFCLNVITNVFIQIDFTNNIEKAKTTLFDWPTTNPKIIN